MKLNEARLELVELNKLPGPLAKTKVGIVTPHHSRRMDDLHEQAGTRAAAITIAITIMESRLVSIMARPLRQFNTTTNFEIIIKKIARDAWTAEIQAFRF